MTVQGMGEVVWRRRGVQWVGNDSLPRAPETAFSFCRRHRSVSRRFHGLFQERCPLATPADKGGKKKNRREKRSKRNGTTNGGASSNHRITYLGRGEFLRVWDEGQGTKKGKLYVKRDRFIDGGELSMIVICFVFFFFFFRFGKIYEKIFFFRFESNRNILIGFLCFIIWSYRALLVSLFVFLFFFFPPIWIVYFEGLFKDCREYFVIRLGTFLFSYVFHTPMLFPSALSVSRDDGCLFFSFFSFRVIVTISAFIRVF